MAMMKRSVWVIFILGVFSSFSSSIAHGDLRYGSISDDASFPFFDQVLFALPLHLSTALGICFLGFSVYFQIIWDGYGVFSGKLGVKGCLSELFLEFGGSIAFDLRSEVSFLIQVFGLVMVCSQAGRESSGGGIRRRVGISHFLVFNSARLW
ncbi:hypothetical protein MtrunA17_Chr1g0190861 [Medicago truncatula]|uniref:Transmembrane protein n=1 Tax=Medicago truncatula TaxID=3880 RepID=A0A396JWW5_MEDTR|nr:hypothetical protein MtrunA17_Chr1g0190861 [Medicago truncatula]